MSNLRRSCLVALALLIVPSSTYAQAPSKDQSLTPLESLPIARHTLDNGLRVILSEDHTVPTVAIAVYYDVGSRDEEKGRSGFAHLFEHMMFQGSANVAKGEHFSLVMNRGGDMNGTTSNDRTNYYETLPANEIELGLWLEADRMKSLAITQDNFENQRQTVMEERRQRIDNQPYVPSMLLINELAYGDYFPYAHSTIGDMQDLQNAPLEAVQEFFDRYYAPNNAVLSIAGNIDPAQTLNLVKKYFDEIKSRKTPTFSPGIPKKQMTERVHKTWDANATLPAFHLAYPIPPSRTADHYPLELLAMVLSDGQSSMLYQRLVKELEICQEASAATDDRRGPDLFSFWGVMARGHEPTEAREVIYVMLENIAAKGVKPRDLEKAQNRLRSAFVFGLQSNRQRAMHLAEFELYWGDANLLRGELDRYLKVVNEDIQRVAATYLLATSRTVLDVLPGEKPATKASDDKGGAQ